MVIDFLGKGINPTILTSAMWKIIGQTKLLKLGMAINLGDANLNLKPVKRCFEKLNLRCMLAERILYLHMQIHAERIITKR